MTDIWRVKMAESKANASLLEARFFLVGRHCGHYKSKFQMICSGIDLFNLHLFTVTSLSAILHMALNEANRPCV